MRKAALIFSLVLCICALGVNAQALPAPGATMDKAAFLASLQAPKPVEASSHHLATKSSCTVSLTCDVGGYFLSCSSANGDCQAGSTWVKCDGNQQDCPVCYKSKVCCDGSTIECFGWTSCGPNGVRTVVCDGVVQDTCPPISQCGP
jgi:hypothetical protein